jgi:hypothetical protein
MTSKELVIKTIKFDNSERLPHNFPPPYGSDFFTVGLDPSPDYRPGSGGKDEWGSTWENIGVCTLGEVKDFVLKDWADFDKLSIPDVMEERRWKSLEGVRGRAGDKFLLADGLSLYERIHFIRGLENTWADIYEAPENLGRLLDILAEMSIKMIGRYADFGVDGYFFLDDWGLQERLMISPAKWREIWKPRYARVFQAAHDAGILVFMHSCGYIVDILDDLIEIGLDVVHMDQQENMGLKLLGSRFGGRLTFYSCVDIQKTMVTGTPDEIRAYCRQMVKLLGRREGGFIPRWYGDLTSPGHTQLSLDTMCDEFMKISEEMYGK